MERNIGDIALGCQAIMQAQRVHVKRIKDRFPKKKKEKEVPESKKLCPTVIDIKGAVCRHYKMGESELQKSRRGVENEVRDLAIYLLRVIRSERLKKTGEEFNQTNYSSVSNAISRVKKTNQRFDLFPHSFCEPMEKTGICFSNPLSKREGSCVTRNREPSWDFTLSVINICPEAASDASRCAILTSVPMTV